jgi:acetolactate synthase small subunit
MKQTAVEWIFLQMENLITKAKVTDMDNNDFVISKVKLLQQAKEMEKQQIIDAI